MSSYRLSVPKPCTQNWNDMVTRENGKYCISCQKTIIDFSQLSDEDVILHFSRDTINSTCGRFRKSQLDRIQIHIPTYLFKKRMPKWQKYLVILFICFGSNVFSVNIVFGKNPAPSAQTEKNIPQKDKKKNPKKRSKTHLKFRFKDFVSATSNFVIDASNYVLGFVQQEPAQPIVLFPYHITAKTLQEQEPITLATSDHPFDREEGSDDNRKKSNSQRKTEFLLPPTSNRRRRKGTK